MKDSTILVLNSHCVYRDHAKNPKADCWKPATLINSAGEQEELSCFKRQDVTKAWHSCPVNWKNQLFIFGGYKEKRQVSRLIGYKLKHVGDLTFNHVIGACSVMGNQHIFLCFSSEDEKGSIYKKERKRCRRSTGPLKEFLQMTLSSYKHAWIQTSCSDSKLTFCDRKSAILRPYIKSLIRPRDWQRIN